MELGKNNHLTIVRRAEQGFYLDGGATGDILLPNRYVKPGMKEGDEVDVFVYLDQDERPVATTETPLARVGEFAWLEVAWVNKYGAFLKWGLMKDLFCPFREQKMRMEQGKSYIVYVKVDEESHRLMATAKVDRYLDSEQWPPYKHGDEVDILVWQKTDMGFKVIVNNRFQGQLYDNQIFQPLTSGCRTKAYIDHIREDHKIDLTLQPTGHAHATAFADTLLQYLRDNGGHCDLGDKSDATLIGDRFKVSKKVYKQAVGDLYRRKLITIDEEGKAIQLVSNE